MATRHWKIDESVPGHILVPELFSPEECATTIARFEDVGFTPATVHRAYSDKVEPEHRNNDRARINDACYAMELYKRIRAHLPRKILGHTPSHMHDAVRCYRYAVGQRFAPHRDGSIFVSPDKRTMLTFMVYLNQDYGGGETIFLSNGKGHPGERVEPKTGSVLLFQHPLLHEGAPVVSGRKYVLRGDVVYAPLPSSA